VLNLYCRLRRKSRPLGDSHKSLATAAASKTKVPKCKSRLSIGRQGVTKKGTQFPTSRRDSDVWRETATIDGRTRKINGFSPLRKSSVVIAAALRRSEASVVGRIYVLKKRAAAGSDVAGPPSSNKGSEWSPADEQRLTEMTATGKSLSEIAAALGRTEAAVENRIHVLKHKISAI
jgi:hypothetical protein